jgi:hypothetical protein
LSSCLLSKNFKDHNIRNIILHAVLYGWETWSLILRQEQRLRVLENRVLRRIFGIERVEGVRGTRRLQNELQNLYASPNIRVIKSRMR